MRILRNLGMVVVAWLVLASGAWATGVANGPGGRMYFSGRNSTSDNNVLIRSVVFNADWTINTFETHGVVTNHRDDWVAPTWGPADMRFAPQIETNRGTGYSDLVMGLWYNNSPASGVTQTATPWGDITGKTMDILRIGTSAGSQTVTVLGDGRAANAGGSTDVGRFALVDPAKTFVGPNGGYIVEGYRSDSPWDMGTFIARDADSSGQIGDSNADYTLLYADHFTMGVSSVQDAVVLGDHIFVAQTWNGIMRFDRQTVAQGYRAGAQWCNTAGYGAWPATHLAMAEIGGHDAGFWYTHTNLDGYNHLILSIDLNNDNDALDSGETLDLGKIGGGQAFPNLSVYRDLEYIEGGPDKHFVVGLSYDLSTMTVLQIGDNLALAGTTTINLGTNLSNGTFSLTAMRFANAALAPVPEPVSLALLGTGAFGLGWLRRRRMK